MKKKLLTLLLTVFALSTCVFTLTACNHQHSYTTEVFEPTCTTGGYSKHTCSCGGIYTDNFVNPLGHSFTNYISDNNATFYSDGTKTATCDRNGCNVTDTTTDTGSKFSNGLKYALNSDNKSYSVTGLGACTDTNVVISSTYKNKPVTSIGYRAFEDCDSLTSVKIGNSVTSIGGQAFFDCDNLTSVTIGNSVTSIGDYAFAYCVSLTNVTIGNGVTSIGNGAFYNCDSLIYNIQDNLKYLGNSSNPYIYLAGIVDTNITTATIDTNCKFIGEDALAFCSSLTSIVIPNSVTSIGNFAFFGCRSLTSVKIGNSVTSIGNYAFGYCSSLTNIKVDANNTTYKDIDGNLYSKDGTTLIQYAIGKTQTTFTIPNSVTSIGNYAFEYCDSLTSVTIGNSVTSIGEGAFYNCDSLIYNIKANLKYLGNNSNPYLYLAGVEDKSITTATIDSNCKFIGEDALAFCRSLTSIEIPNSVTSIGEFAFGSCDSLTSITFADTSTWYITRNLSDWQNKTGGTETNVTNPSTNAIYFKSMFSNYCWYKK